MLKLVNGILLVTLMMTSSAHASEQDDRRTFENLFGRWATSFNQKDLPETCNLFSRSVAADFQGTPKTFESICDGFKKMFNEEGRVYRYRFKIHRVYRSQAQAAVRITWHLETFKDAEKGSTTREEGLDILEQDSRGEWKVVAFVAYEARN